MHLMVYRYDGCLIRHLYRRFWPKSDKPFGARNSCYRVVQGLVAQQWFQGVRLPSLTGIGAGHLFLTLGPKGRQLVAEQLGLSRSDLQRLRKIETPFAAAHHAAICDFRLELELACERTGRAELAEWVPERRLRTPPILKVKDPRPSYDAEAPAMIPLIADGEFSVVIADGRSQSYRLEIDMGTIPSKRIRARLRAYLAHADKDDRPVLWVVLDKARREAIVQWALEEAEGLGDDASLFWVTEATSIEEQTILGPIWWVVDGPMMALIPSASGQGSAATGGDRAWKRS